MPDARQIRHIVPVPICNATAKLRCEIYPYSTIIYGSMEVRIYYLWYYVRASARMRMRGHCRISRVGGAWVYNQPTNTAFAVPSQRTSRIRDYWSRNLRPTKMKVLIAILAMVALLAPVVRSAPVIYSRPRTFEDELRAQQIPSFPTTCFQGSNCGGRIILLPQNELCCGAGGGSYVYRGLGYCMNW